SHICIGRNVDKRREESEKKEADSECPKLHPLVVSRVTRGQRAAVVRANEAAQSVDQRERVAELTGVQSVASYEESRLPLLDSTAEEIEDGEGGEEVAEGDA